ncbi:MAG: hypothetical protein K0S55_1087 [Clostridia bacterium]|nr:hypothetical protein [Clostridia bacterium]
MPLPNNPNTYSIISDAEENYIYLLLTSVANIEICLSKLIDTEAAVLRILTSVENDSRLTVSDINDFNKSVQRILKKLCMLQMLFQLKLEYINMLICINSKSAKKTEYSMTSKSSMISKSSDSDNLVSTVPVSCKADVKNTITVSKNLAEKAKLKLTELVDPFNTVKVLKYCLKGRGHGQILKRSDPFYDGTAIIQLFFNDDCSKDNFLCYTAMKDIRMMNFTAYPESLITTSEVICGCKRIKIEGIGAIIMKERFKPDKKDMGSFELTIFFDTSESKKIFFQMAIKATKNVEFNQMSGKIDAECSNLQIKEEY